MPSRQNLRGTKPGPQDLVVVRNGMEVAAKPEETMGKWWFNGGFVGFSGILWDLKHDWWVVWNICIHEFDFPMILGIIPIDELRFFRGIETTINHQ